MALSNEDTTSTLKSDSQNNMQADSAPTPPASTSTEPEEVDIDLAILAQKLYNLCKQELKIERERLIRSRFR